MHPTYFFIIIFTLSSTLVFSQKNAVAGAVSDSTGIGLPGATVVLLQEQDSVLSSFGVSEMDGRFELKRVAAGEYLLQVSYVGYVTHWQPISVTENAGKVDAGRIVLTPASADLSEVEVTAEHIPLRMRNDTLEYNANAFQTQPNAVVEDLLKKLPGVEVDRNGTIRAQGEQVQNVLVDGKEFFGSDPQIATKNLPANAVDKVQVFDKKSERAEFTGIDDGREQKSINLELKEDKKSGYFGNASGAGGAYEKPTGGLQYDRYEAKFNLNRFSQNTQLSAIGMLNNTNQQGFSLDDYIRFQGGLSNLMSGGGSGGGGRISLSFDPSQLGIPLEGAGLDQGFTTTHAAGLNLNHEFGKKTELNASYFFSEIENDIDRTATRQSLFENENFTSEETGKRLNRNQNHRLNMTLRHEIDSFQNLVLRTNLGFNDAHLRSENRAETFGSEGVLENKNLRDYRSDGENLSLSSNLSYRRRFQRKGRALVADLNWGLEQSGRNAYLDSQSSFFEGGNPSGNDNVLQRQGFEDDADSYGLSLSWTEPLGRLFGSKRNYLELVASRRNFSNDSGKDFFDISGPAETLNPELSNRYLRDYRYDRGGLNLMLNRKKFNLTLGADLQNSCLQGDLVDEDLVVKQDFTRLLPRMFFDYDLGTSHHFNIDYLTSLREPSPEQLQPVVDNSDPLNTYTGNPDLRPEYQHSLRGGYMIFDQFTFTSFFANVNASYTSDRITNASTVDSLFRQHIRPVNVDYDFSLQGNMQFRTPLRPLKTNISLSYRSMLNQSILFVNDVENNVNRQRHSFGLSLDNRKKDVVDITLGGRLTFNSTSYSVSSQLDQRYLEQRLYADLVVLPTKKWELSSSFDYSVYSQETFGEERAVPIWKASITRYFLPNDRGQLRLSANDILNRNIGLNRNSQLNYVEEERIASLGRYVMLTFAYSISGFGKKSGGIEIRMMDDR